MSQDSRHLWERALDSLRAAEALVGVSPDDAASRAYYSAFYAASALFALGGRAFRRHSALEAAVHRDLVRQGVWPERLGATYTELLRLREVADYGGGRHVSREQAAGACQDARSVLQAICVLHADQFTMPEPND